MTGVPLLFRRWRHAPVLLLLLCFLALGLAPRAAGSGGFTLTGSMTIPRSGAVAAPLPGGRVLVAGPDASAELFDSATNTFSPTGSMSVRRSGAAAAPLPDGRVLVAGGEADCPPCGPLSSAEIFDPASNSFSSAGVGAMSVRRSGAVAAPLPDGRMLVAGGFGDCDPCHQLSSAEIFDPATNTFSSTGIGSMSVARDRAVAAPLPDGRVLVAGGYYLTCGGSHAPCLHYDQSSAEVFDPATNAFSSAGISMSVSRSGAVAAALSDGRVLVAGGTDFDVFSGEKDLSSAEIFDPATNSFRSGGIGSMSIPRRAASASPLPGGRVLVAGGCCSGAPFPETQVLASAEIFAPVTCRGKQATIVGRFGIHQIGGTRGADVIVAMGGNDLVFGGAGNDVICGNHGDNTIIGGAGNDKLYGRAGNDKLYGKRGNDKLHGQKGNDTLKGGPANDKLVGGKGKDKLKGGPGKDKQVQ